MQHPKAPARGPCVNRAHARPILVPVPQYCYKNIAAKAGSRNNGDCMTLEKMSTFIGIVIERAWPLCLIAMLNWWWVMHGSSPYAVFTFLYGFAGCLVFLRGFGLATSLPIYCLAFAAFLSADPSRNEITLLQTMLNLEYSARIYLRLLVTAFKSALMALPFSLFFFDRMNGYTALLKIPLCVFFLVLVLEPTFLILMLAIFGM